MARVQKEKIRADQVRVGDLIALTAGPIRPVFRAVDIGEGRLFGRVPAVRITVENAAGYRISQNFPLRRPLNRAVE